MKTIRLGWGIVLVAIAVFPALAQTPPTKTSLEGPAPAVPRPLPGQETVPGFTEVFPEEGPIEPTVPTPLYGPPAPEEPKVERERGPDPMLDGANIPILGIDRTDFPEIMVVFGLKDDQGKPITDINRRYLEVTEDEAPQDILSLNRAIPERIPGPPLNIMFLIDSSGSMQAYMDVVQNAAARFVENFHEEDSAGVVGFCQEPIVIEPPTPKIKTIQKGIYSLRPRGFTALYDSVYLGLRMLSTCGDRRAIILVTDGKDDDGTGVQLSRRSLDDVLKFANETGIPIFVIGIGDGISHKVLERMGEETKGDFLFAPTGEEVEGLYKDVARMLGRGDEGYYKLHYHASEDERDGTTRTIILKYRHWVGLAEYPAPRSYIWPISKVLN